ncbi:MAG TPA: hypothetical protein VHJ37_01385 [Thermoleophilaceae bacterium]|jgi:hypothetical protein|nr:hypothetical protein [Thermoleophilaceae bacterium]
MARLMVLVSPPHHLGLEEAEHWLREELAPVTAGAGVRSAALSRLAAASRRWSQEWGWLIELEFEDAQAAREAVAEDACRMLLGDLRLVGMRPTVALVDGAEQLEA